MCIEMGFSYSSYHSFPKNFKTNKVRFVSGGPNYVAAKKVWVD